MPKRIKVYLSIIVAIVAIAAFIFQQYLGKENPSYAALLLGFISIVAMWIFPEVSHKKKDSGQDS
jgi:uncharacterized membrane protein YfcA